MSRIKLKEYILYDIFLLFRTKCTYINITFALILATKMAYFSGTSVYPFCIRPQTAASILMNFKLQDPQTTKRKGGLACCSSTATHIQASDQLSDGFQWCWIHSLSISVMMSRQGSLLWDNTHKYLPRFNKSIVKVQNKDRNYSWPLGEPAWEISLTVNPDEPQGRHG